MSPVGVPPLREHQTAFAERQERCLTRFIFRRVIGLWESHWSPAAVCRKIGYYPARSLCRGFTKRRLGMDEVATEACAELLV